MKWQGKVNFGTLPEYDGNKLLSRDSGEINDLTEKTTISGNDIVIIEDCEASNSKKKVKLSNIVNVFGAEFQEASSDGISSTTSTSYQQKLRMTTGTLPSGKYRIGFSYEYRGSSTTYDFECQIQINDTTTIHTLNDESQDGASYKSASGFYYYTGSGALNIDIDYSSEDAAATAYIRKVRLEIWRTS